jgi:uncharacterized protein
MLTSLGPELLLAVCMLIGAALYTSVGHAGASAYIALMALFGVAPTVMRPTALTLNILVASFTSFRYLRAGLFRWRTLWPFLCGALPFAFAGGAIQLPGIYYRPLVGVMLMIGGARLVGLTPTPTCQTGQGGSRKGMRPLRQRKGLARMPALLGSIR